MSKRSIVVPRLLNLGATDKAERTSGWWWPLNYPLSPDQPLYSRGGSLRVGEKVSSASLAPHRQDTQRCAGTVLSGEFCTPIPAFPGGVGAGGPRFDLEDQPALLLLSCL